MGLNGKKHGHTKGVIGLIDTDKYEGHTQGPWKASHDVVEYGHIVNNTGWRVYVGEHEKRAEIQNYRFDHDELSEANARLIADAPLLLAEVKRLREAIEQLTVKVEGMSTGYRKTIVKALREMME